MSIKCVICYRSESEIVAQYGRDGSILCSIPCGHIHHAVCLKVWFSAQTRMTCPTCRARIYKKTDIVRLFLDIEPLPAKNLEKELKEVKSENEILKKHFESMAHQIARKIQDIHRLDQCNTWVRRKNSSLEEKLLNAQTTEYNLLLTKSELTEKKKELKLSLDKNGVLKNKLASLHALTVNMIGPTAQTTDSLQPTNTDDADCLVNGIMQNVAALDKKNKDLLKDLSNANMRFKNLKKDYKQERSVNFILSGIVEQCYKPSEVHSSQAQRTESPNSDPDAIILLSQICPKLKEKKELEKEVIKSNVDASTRSPLVCRQLIEDTDNSGTDENRPSIFSTVDLSSILVLNGLKASIGKATQQETSE